MITLKVYLDWCEQFQENKNFESLTNDQNNDDAYFVANMTTLRKYSIQTTAALSKELKNMYYTRSESFIVMFQKCLLDICSFEKTINL